MNNNFPKIALHSNRLISFGAFFLVLIIIISTISNPVASAKLEASIKASEPEGQTPPIEFTNFVYLPAIFHNYPALTLNPFGVQMGQITVAGGLDKVVEAQSVWVGGTAVKWSAVEPNQGDRDWSGLGNIPQHWINATQNGLQPIANVRSTPSWAQLIDGYFCGPMEDIYFDEFATFMYDLVSIYKNPPYSVKYWEIWNEPDVDHDTPGVTPDNDWGCWGDKNDTFGGGRYYADMLKVVYPQIKAADPTAQVLIGGLLLDCDPRGTPSVCASLTVPHNDKLPKFFEGILVNGGGPYFDGVSFHAYDYGDSAVAVGRYSNLNWTSTWNTTGPVLIAKLNYLQSLLASNNVSGKYLINTESAVVCDNCINNTNYETTKAYYVAQAYASAIRYGLKGNLWYSLKGWRNSGLLTSTLDERPAFVAYEFGRQILAPSTPIGDIGTSDISNTTGVKGYKFHKFDRDVWIIWSLDGSNHTVNLVPGNPDAVYDSLGNPLASSSSLQVTITPKYIEWIP